MRTQSTAPGRADVIGEISRRRLRLAVARPFLCSPYKAPRSPRPCPRPHRGPRGPSLMCSYCRSRFALMLVARVAPSYRVLSARVPAADRSHTTSQLTGAHTRFRRRVRSMRTHRRPCATGAACGVRPWSCPRSDGSPGAPHVVEVAGEVRLLHRRVHIAATADRPRVAEPLGCVVDRLQERLLGRASRSGGQVEQGGRSRWRWRSRCGRSWPSCRCR